MDLWDKDVNTFTTFDEEKFVPLEKVPGLPGDLFDSWRALGYVEGYIDTGTDHLLLRKKDGGQILRHLGGGDWLQVHPREENTRIQRIIF